MKFRNITIGLVSVAAVGLVIYYISRKKALEEQAMRISDEGYETAEDVLYPMRRRRWL